MRPLVSPREEYLCRVRREPWRSDLLSRCILFLVSFASTPCVAGLMLVGREWTPLSLGYRSSDRFVSCENVSPRTLFRAGSCRGIAPGEVLNG